MVRSVDLGQVQLKSQANLCLQYSSLLQSELIMCGRMSLFCRIYGNLSCDLYVSGGYCALVLSEPLQVITNWSRDSQEVVKEDLDALFRVVGGLTGGAISQCSRRSLPLLCLYTFPPCDPAYNVPVYQPICKRDCEIMRDYVCPAAWEAMLALGDNVDFGENIDDFDCEKLSYPNGGDAPMCVSTEGGGEILHIHTPLL